MTTILILSVVGIVAILAELVLPGGVLGVAGILCLVMAVITTFVEYGATAGMIALVALVILGFLTLNLWMRFFHLLPFTNKLLLHDEVGSDSELEERQNLIGTNGTALTDIHPSGRADLNGDRIDVMSEGAAIEKGANITVVETRGPSIFVREIADGSND